jgi:hypothetical protein
MTKIKDMIQRINDAKEALEDAEGDAATFLYPIIIAAGIGNPHHEGIIRLELRRDTLEVETEWSARNCRNTSDYRVPLSILDAEDPIAAAIAWKSANAEQRAKQERAFAIAEIERLQKSLNQENSHD